MRVIKEITIDRDEYMNNYFYPGYYDGLRYIKDVFENLGEDCYTEAMNNYVDTYIMLLNYYECLINTTPTEDRKHFIIKIYENS